MIEDPSTILQVDNLSAGYGNVAILQNISLSVPERSIVSIVGSNGAGKSTLLKAIYGLAKITAGEVTFRRSGLEENIAGWRPNKITALGMNYVPQLDNVFASMTVVENLQLGAFLDKARFALKANEIFEIFPVLYDRRQQRAGTMSGGERQMLAFARGLMGDPSLLLLDEPSAGVAPQLVDELFDRVVHVARGGVSIVMVEQNARRSLEIADYAYVLETGRNRFEGRGADLAADSRVEELYLGGGLPTSVEGGNL